MPVTAGITSPAARKGMFWYAYVVRKLLAGSSEPMRVSTSRGV